MRFSNKLNKTLENFIDVDVPTKLSVAVNDCGGRQTGRKAFKI